MAGRHHLFFGESRGPLGQVRCVPSWALHPTPLPWPLLPQGLQEVAGILAGEGRGTVEPLREVAGIFAGEGALWRLSECSAAAEACPACLCPAVCSLEPCRSWAPQARVGGRVSPTRPHVGGAGAALLFLCLSDSGWMEQVGGQGTGRLGPQRPVLDPMSSSALSAGRP